MQGMGVKYAKIPFRAIYYVLNRIKKGFKKPLLNKEKNAAAVLSIFIKISVKLEKDTWVSNMRDNFYRSPAVVYPTNAILLY